MADLVEGLPFQSQVLRTGEIVVAGKKFSAHHVVQKLAPHLTESRKARIAQVIQGRTYNVATVAEHLYDIGNISAVMRSAESFGFLPFHIIERAGSKYKMSDRISRGTEKWLDIQKHASTSQAVQVLKSAGYKIYASDLQATHKLQEIDFSQPIALVFGNEKDGISQDMRDLCDGRFLIPMYGFAQSFNISVAAALTFYHAHTARLNLGKAGDLTSDQSLLLQAHYYLRTLDSAPEILLHDD
jgi:tRNA (guanosine-2'-O-)-methyltransferase